ncbi:MAG TPA: phosphatase PAP2 family protein [Sphingomicrobium sp.]|nr:phosphatase PAP2 family protein [Sphingomicrobium sp.]
MTAAKLRHGAAVAVLACVWLAMLLLGVGSFDRTIAASLYAGPRPVLVTAARTFTFLGDPAVLVSGGILAAAWLSLRGRGRIALGLLLVIFVGRALTEAQKYWVARARPDVEPHLVIVQTSSFPSGHAASSMIFYLTLALALTRPGRGRRLAAAAAILLSLLIGASRVMLGVHWPSDVVGGWSFGMLWVMVTLPASQRLFGADSRVSAKRL